MKEQGKKVQALIPLDLDGHMFSDEWESGKKKQILARIAADFRNWDTDNTIFEQAFERVIQALRANDKDS